MARRIVGAALVLAAAVGIVVAPGVDEREVTAVDPSVWAVQTGAAQRFARVNTAVAEVDTVKAAASISDLAQHAGRLLVFTAGASIVTPVEAGRPVEVTAASDGSVPTPAGTVEVAASGDVVAYRTQQGQVLVGRLSDGTALEPVRLDPGVEGFRAAAVAVDSSGLVTAYCPETRQVLRARADGRVAGLDPVPSAPAQATMTLAGGAWVLLAADSGLLWREGAEAHLEIEVDESAVLQRSGPGDAVYVADAQGLLEVPAEGDPVRAFAAGVPGAVPARPVDVDGTVHAAWLAPGEARGALWSSDGTAVDLDYGGEALPERIVPVLRTNGSRAILNESRSGWVWDVPTGLLLASSQGWEQESEPTDADSTGEVAQEPTTPEPPVAEDDALGVREGRQVRLPVLLNDHDPNGDVLTIVADEVEGPDADFATVRVGDDGQSLVADVAAGATGSATLSYVVTDGTADDGLRSDPASVTLTVSPDGDSAAPVWSGDGGVTAWPSPEVVPGSTVTVDVLRGWVDPDGDPLYVAGATTEAEHGAVTVTPQGRLTFHHTDASATQGATAAVEVTVADSTGEQTTRELTVTVRPDPRLVVEPTVATVVAGTRLTVPLAERVTGARGPVTVTDVAVDLDGATVEALPGQATFGFEAAAPATYLVDVAVTDGVSEARGRVRVTVIDPAQEQLAAVPLTAFVRPSEDSTVDVLASVANPGGRVLLLSELSREPADGATLSAAIVGHGALRVSGSTADGRPGVIGVVRYAVSDGSGDEDLTVAGELTVMMLGAAEGTPPLALDDAVTVRAGGQVDIPVLDNDSAAAGAVVALDAGSVDLPADQGLAFPAGPLVRYLAPDEPGTYVIDYAAYVLGFPSQRDTARVVVTVTGGAENTAPVPPDVRGRVASGQEVRIPVDFSGLDADGDAVLLDRIAAQPAQGSARVSADGTALVYSSYPGARGQDAFDFEVVDERGLRATGSARIGIIETTADPAPVTSTDVVQAQAVEGRRIVVSPLANDLDLAGGTLTLTGVRPDARVGTEEHARLAAMLPDADALAAQAADGTVAITVTEDPGTFAFLYTVETSGGSVGHGRIVVKTVREPVVDVPVIADTILAFDTREAFVTGVDVLSGKVAWASGDPAGLDLEPWGDQADVTATGRTLAGPLPATRRIVPFQATGTDFAGDPVTAYGFLRIPGEDDARLALKDPVPAIEVAERDRVDIDVAAMLALPAGTRIEVDADAVEAGGVRAQGRCRALAGTRVRYEAGEGAPYADTCRVAVRLAGQEAWTVVPLPITIIPDDPQPLLSPVSIEVSPGSSETVDLLAMVRWPAGATPRGVSFAAAYSGSRFAVEQDDQVLRVRALGDASTREGQTETVRVTVEVTQGSAFTGTVPLTLVVGPLPAELPQGATVAKVCSQADANGCDIRVIGGTGEVNPVPELGALELGEVTGGADCPDVTFTADGDVVRASWPSTAPGALCSARFTVTDALGRDSGAARAGALALDLRGYPRAPAQVTQVGYGDGTVTLAVDPGAASGAYPALEGFDVEADGVPVATCTAAGRCTTIAGLANGERTRFVVYARNAVGRSPGAAAVTAWAYAPPAAPVFVSTAPTVTAGGEGRAADIVLDIADRTTRAIRFTVGGTVQERAVTRTGRVTFAGVTVGSNTPVQVTATPVTALELPALPGADAAGAGVSFDAHGIGRPTIDSVVTDYVAGADSTTVTVTVTAGGAGASTVVGLAAPGEECVPSADAVDGRAALSVDVAQLAVNAVDACAVSRVGSRDFGTAQATGPRWFAYSDPGAPVLRSGYALGASCAGDGAACTIPLLQAPRFAPPDRGDASRFALQYEGVATGADFEAALGVGAPQEVLARWCVEAGELGRVCSEQATTVTAASGPAYRATVAFPQCTVGVAPAPTLGGDAADFAVTVTRFAEDGTVVDSDADMRFARVTVAFQGALAGVAPWQSDTVECGGWPAEPDETPAPDDSPTPDASPSPDPSPSPDAGTTTAATTTTATTTVGSDPAAPAAAG